MLKTKLKFIVIGILVSATLFSCEKARTSTQSGMKNQVAISASSDTKMCEKRAYPEIGGEFELIDQTGKTLTDKDFSRGLSLIFFGFTNCPDICPATLVRLRQAYNMLPDFTEKPTTIFVSVDPQRDTPELLREYLSLSAFPQDVVGLTGPDEAIRNLASEFFADYARIDMPDSLAEYTMDHTTLIYLMDKDWQLKTFFTHEDSSKDIADCLLRFLN